MRDEQVLVRPAVYEIRVEGVLDERWSDWFHGMTIASDSGVTVLTGPVSDQAILRGMLTKIWDLSLTLVSVMPIEADPYLLNALGGEGVKED
jgi:hypothetical protein